MTTGLDLVGTNLADTLTGSAFDDTIEGLGGNDLLAGLDGDDVLSGSSADDLLDGGAGNDTIHPGTDPLIFGQEDTLQGDTLLGGAGDDVLHVPASTFLGPVARIALLDGGEGSDTLVWSFAQYIYFDLERNSSWIRGIENVALSAYTTILIGDGGDNSLGAGGTVFGGSGADTIGGATRANGGPGMDRFVDVQIIEDLEIGESIVVSGANAQISSAVIEGGQTILTVAVPGQPDLRIFLHGFYAADDLAVAVEGNATVFTYAEAAPPPGGFTQTGGQGDDFLVGTNARDVVLGLDGRDTVFAHNGGDSVEGGAGDDYIVGGGGYDTFSGGADNDVLFGGPGADSLLGGEGNDFLFSQGGLDTLEGGAGNDRLHVGGDERFALAGDGIFDVLVIDNANRFTVVDKIDLGNTENQNVSVQAEPNGPVLRGFDAVDASIALTAVEVIGAVHDGIYGNVVIGSAFDDTITGSTSEDILMGGNGVDLIDGGAGNDTLIADLSNDRLTGGAGLDTFFFAGGPRGDSLFVTDFTPGEDTMLLGAAFNLTPAQAASQLIQGDSFVTLNLIGGATINFSGRQVAEFSVDDFAVL